MSVLQLLVEAAKGICKGQIGHKSKDLKARQSGNPPEVIAYADKANERLMRKYYKMIRHGKKKNVAVTAAARELACFIWGMMTDNISSNEQQENWRYPAGASGCFEVQAICVLSLSAVQECIDPRFRTAGLTADH